MEAVRKLGAAERSPILYLGFDSEGVEFSNLVELFPGSHCLADSVVDLRLRGTFVIQDRAQVRDSGSRRGAVATAELRGLGSVD